MSEFIQSNLGQMTFDLLIKYLMINQLQLVYQFLLANLLGQHV
jgi:hypothetical protein